jgi:hypothetical protein
MIFFHLVLTLQSRFSCFCMLLTFRYLPNVKRIPNFCHIIFFGIREWLEEEVNMGMQ